MLGTQPLATSGRMRFAALHEARPVGDVVVERHGNGVGLLGEPVDARTACLGGIIVDLLNELPAYAAAALKVRDGRLVATYVIRNPDKLRFISGAIGAVELPV